MGNSPDASDSPSSLVTHAASTSTRLPQADFSLDEYQWQYRVVLLFTPSEEFPAYQQQMQAWQTDAEGIRVHDLKLVEVFAAGESRADGQAMASPPPGDSAATERLRAQFGVSAEAFAAILVGKDGTEKQRSQTPIDLAMLFRTIDSMPMRQQEMNSQRSPQG